MPNRGWLTFDRYPYRESDLYTRFTQWCSSIWVRIYNGKYYIWQTKEPDYFTTIYEGSFLSSFISITWTKVLIILGVFAMFVFIWKYFEKMHYRVIIYDSQTTATDGTLSPDYESYIQKSEPQHLGLQNVSDESYIQPFPLETPPNEHPKSTTVYGQKNIPNFVEKCKICRCRAYSSVEFKWPNGPLQVYFTGSFLDWKAKVVLSRRRDQRKNLEYFSVTFVLPKGHHEFKFLVEGVWRISKDYKTCINQLGEESNYVTLT